MFVEDAQGRAAHGLRCGSAEGPKSGRPYGVGGLLRRSYRDERGRPQKETLANLSALPEVAIVALCKVLSGAVLVEPDEAFEIERSLSHGGLAAVHAMATKLGVKKLLGPECRERDLAYALVLSRVLHPTSKLSTLGW